MKTLIQHFFSRKERKLLQAARIGRSFAKERYREIKISVLLEAFETGQARLEEVLPYCRVNREKQTAAGVGKGERKQSRQTQLQPCCFSNYST